MLSFLSILITLAALFGYVNHKWLRLPTSIGVMLISVVLAISLKIVELIQPGLVSPFREFITSFDFSSFVLDFILCFLLFAGSLHVNLYKLKGAWTTVLSYSTLGVLISTAIIGLLSYAIIQLMNFEIGIIPCLLFGALISPTDPIAVIAILSKYNVPEKLKTEIIGESLFNDGMGVVVFTVIFSLTASGSSNDTGVAEILKIFVVEVLGGLGIGLVIGFIGFHLMKSIDHYQTEILITLAVVTGGYSLASSIHSSGPLAMVVAGLIIGNKGKEFAMSDITLEYVDKFWELIDEICNILLFILMGLEIFLVPVETELIIAGTALIVVALIARYISLLPAFMIFNRGGIRNFRDLNVLTWGGLRGGISVALALSLTGRVQGSNLFIVATYCIVLFSILVQATTIKKLLAKY